VNSRRCGFRGRTEPVDHGKECGFYSDNSDQTMKGLKQIRNMIYVLKLVNCGEYLSSEIFLSISTYYPPKLDWTC